MSESMMYIFLAIIAVLTVAEIVMAVLLTVWRGNLNDEADAMRRYSELIVELFHETRDYEKKLSERMLTFAEKCDFQTEMYNKFCKIALEMNDNYDKLGENLKKIAASHERVVKGLKESSEQYSNAYDQFKLCTDKLKELSYHISDLANVSTEDEYSLTLHEACDTVCLDCPYDACKCDTCPVYAINHKDDIPDGIEGETPPDLESMIEFYETDGFKDAREKGADS